MTLTPHELRELEVNEAWLRGFATPAPAPDALERLRAAVEFEARAAASPNRRVFRLGAPAGAWAAAAMLLLSAGVVWHATRGYQPVPAPEAFAVLDSDRLEEFVSRWEKTDEIDDDAPVLNMLSREMGDLESGDNASWDGSLSQLEEEVMGLETDLTRPWYDSYDDDGATSPVRG